MAEGIDGGCGTRGAAVDAPRAGPGTWQPVRARAGRAPAVGTRMIRSDAEPCGSGTGSRWHRGEATAGDPAARPLPHPRDPAARRRRAGGGRLGAPRARERHHSAPRLPARPPRHGSPGGGPLSGAARDPRRASPRGCREGARSPYSETSRGSRPAGTPGRGVSEGRHATAAHGFPDVRADLIDPVEEDPKREKSFVPALEAARQSPVSYNPW